MSMPWQSQLLECGCTTEPDACEVCLCGLCCTACVYGKTVRGEEHSRSVPLCSPCDYDCDACVSLFFIDWCTFGLLSGLVTYGSRLQLRKRYALDPAPECCGSDFVPHCFCNSCAVLQDFLQLRAVLRKTRREEKAGPGNAPAPPQENHEQTAPPLPEEFMRR